MEEKGMTLHRELPRLIAAARALGSSMLVMLLMTVDEELRKQEIERRKETGHGRTDRS